VVLKLHLYFFIQYKKHCRFAARKKREGAALPQGKKEKIK
jgi:hypothetical protein